MANNENIEVTNNEEIIEGTGEIIEISEPKSNKKKVAKIAGIAGGSILAAFGLYKLIKRGKKVDKVLDLDPDLEFININD